jgi:hypothetical protein
MLAQQDTPRCRQTKQSLWLLRTARCSRSTRTKQHHLDTLVSVSSHRIDACNNDNPAVRAEYHATQRFACIARLLSRAHTFIAYHSPSNHSKGSWHKLFASCLQKPRVADVATIEHEQDEVSARRRLCVFNVNHDISSKVMGHGIVSSRYHGGCGVAGLAFPPSPIAWAFT